MKFDKKILAFLIPVLTLTGLFLLASLSKKNILAQIEDFSHSKSEISKTMSMLTETPDGRLAGSLNGRIAEEKTRNLFKKIGFNTDYQAFEAKVWSRVSLKTAIVPAESDNYRDIKAFALAFSPEVANVQGAIIDCGDGLSDDFEKVKDDVSGKIAMFNIGLENHKGGQNLHRSEKAALAIAYGAIGVISVNGVKGGVLLTGTASSTGDLLNIPAINVSYESGRSIRKWIKDEHHINAEINMVNSYKTTRLRNVIAHHNPKAKIANEKIVIGAHLDSWDVAEGAIDNGIGACSVIEIARLFHKMKLKTKRPIEFVLFMGEEQGLLGSKYYVKNAIETGKIDSIGLMINLDMVNNTKGFNAFGDEVMLDIVENTGKKIQKDVPKYPNVNKSTAGLHSDHQYFMLAGIPICSPNGALSREALDCYHADCDNKNLVNEEEIRNNIKYVAMMLYELANTDKLPKRKSIDQTKAYLEKQGLREKLELANEWNW